MLKYKQQRDKEEQARNKNMLTTVQSEGKNIKPSQPEDKSDTQPSTNIAGFFGVDSAPDKQDRWWQ